MRAAWWWIDRWRQSAAYTDMTAEEQGLYRNLLDEVWLREDHVIPNDERILARISGDHEAWQRSGKKVLGWMKRVPNGWTHETALEVIGQSTRRAETQKRYRDRVNNKTDNAKNNKQPNKADSPSPSPSPSPSQTDGQNGRPANPLIQGKRTDYERESLTLTSRIAELTGEDPVEVFAQAAHYEGAIRQKVNPAGLSDDRLLNTVIDLRKTLKNLQTRERRA